METNKNNYFIFISIIGIISYSLLLLMEENVYANPSDYTVEGDMTRFVTGVAYPKQIVLTGYNARDDQLYTNVELYGGSQYDVDINVYQGDTGELWGTTSLTNVVDVPNNTFELQNQEVAPIVAGTDLRAGYRIVVTVTQFTPERGGVI